VNAKKKEKSPKLVKGTQEALDRLIAGKADPAPIVKGLLEALIYYAELHEGLSDSNRRPLPCQGRLTTTSSSVPYASILTQSHLAKLRKTAKKRNKKAPATESATCVLNRS
jgi:hypothetical protein